MFYFVSFYINIRIKIALFCDQSYDWLGDAVQSSRYSVSVFKNTRAKKPELCIIRFIYSNLGLKFEHFCYVHSTSRFAQSLQTNSALVDAVTKRFQLLIIFSRQVPFYQVLQHSFVKSFQRSFPGNTGSRSIAIILLSLSIIPHFIQTTWLAVS